MNTPELKLLADSQLQTFDQDYVTDKLYAFIIECIDRDFPSGKFSFCDIGGGMGLFTDRLLEHYPLATATLVDNSELLLYKNAEHGRKRLHHGSATEVKYRFNPESFDLVFFNLALHHFVTDSYSKTRAIQSEAVRQGRMLMKPSGRMCVVENNFDGKIIDNFPGWLIFNLTVSKVLAPFVKKLGANTAGCGVCFLSAKEWISTFHKVGLHKLDSLEDYPCWDITFKAKLRNLLLTVRERPRIAFWLSDMD